MNNFEQIASIDGTYEETLNGYEIYVSPNRDHFTGGYEWSTCKDEVEWDGGLEFSITDAINCARDAVAKLSKKE